MSLRRVLEVAGSLGAIAVVAATLSAVSVFLMPDTPPGIQGRWGVFAACFAIVFVLLSPVVILTSREERKANERQQIE